MGIKVGQTLPFCAVNVNGPLVAFYCLVVVFLKVVLTDDGQKVTVTSIQPMHIKCLNTIISYRKIMEHRKEKQQCYEYLS